MSGPLRILREDRISLDDVCEMLGINRSTAYRWCRRGLEHLHTSDRRGGKIITSHQAVERFVAAMNGIELEAAEAATA
jgi:predicted site-specific integrase-resolvase